MVWTINADWDREDDDSLMKNTLSPAAGCFLSDQDTDISVTYCNKHNLIHGSLTSRLEWGHILYTAAR